MAIRGPRVQSNSITANMLLPIRRVRFTRANGDKDVYEQAVLCKSKGEGNNQDLYFSPLEEWSIDKKQNTMKRATGKKDHIITVMPDEHELHLADDLMRDMLKDYEEDIN